jgi:hypothetical protein
MHKSSIIIITSLFFFKKIYCYKNSQTYVMFYCNANCLQFCLILSQALLLVSADCQLLAIQSNGHQTCFRRKKNQGPDIHFRHFVGTSMSPRWENPIWLSFQEGYLINPNVLLLIFYWPIGYVFRWRDNIKEEKMFPKTKYSTNSRAIWFFFPIQSEQAISVHLNHVNAHWVKDMTWRHRRKKKKKERIYVMATWPTTAV